MIKRLLTTTLAVVLFSLSIIPSVSPVLADSCSMQTITVNVREGGPVTIRLDGIFTGVPYPTSAYNLYSPSTGHWVDIGNLITANGGQITLPNGTKDNTGGDLFIEGHNTITLRHWDGGPFFTDLCSNGLDFTNQPVIAGGACDACTTTADCQNGLSCILNQCLPGSSQDQGKDGASCVKNEQCDAQAGYKCQGGDGFWCTTNPDDTSPAPGVCTKQTQTGIFNCSNRGGQCEGIISSTCQNGRTQAECQGCWINPTDPTGSNQNEATIGSCVIPDNTGCGTIGNYCCYSPESKQFTCKEGTVGIEENPTVCKCDDNRHELGESCNAASECKSGVCKENVCSVPLNNCISGGIEQSTCEKANGVFCSREIPNTGTKEDYCCPSQTQCDQVAPPANSSNFSGFCSNAGALSIFTAIGCIPIDTLNKLAAFFITWGLGIGGGFTMLVFAAAAIQYITSQGDPAKLQSSKELLTSAITGLIFLTFCVFILRVIGVNLLGLF